jgi:hypothetical protein
VTVVLAAAVLALAVLAAVAWRQLDVLALSQPPPEFLRIAEPSAAPDRPQVRAIGPVPFARLDSRLDRKVRRSRNISLVNDQFRKWFGPLNLRTAEPSHR